MEVTAKLKNLRMSPRKVRLVAGLIRGASVSQAQQQLTFNKKFASRPILKLLNSAIANADHNFSLDTSTLRIKEIRVDQGQTLKRYMPKAFGTATVIRKRASHITLVLEGEKGTGSTKPKQAAKKKAEPKKPESTMKRPPVRKVAGKQARNNKPAPVRGKERSTQHKGN